MSNLLWLIPVLPLIGFLINGMLRLPKSAAGIVEPTRKVLGQLPDSCCTSSRRRPEWLSSEKVDADSQAIVRRPSPSDVRTRPYARTAHATIAPESIARMHHP